MTRTILGLDIGGANLKAATPDGRAVSVPFALWKQPDRLPAALAELVGRFPEVGELAVTMTGELCDCYETKRQGVNAILDAVGFAAAGRPVRVWGTGGSFLTVAESRAAYMTVAAANWHALASFAGRSIPFGEALLIDVGSTTTDVIPLHDGQPATQNLTDQTRLAARELVYTGVRRTPVCALGIIGLAAELFATTLDVYLTLGLVADDLTDCDTADGRPATAAYARSRLSRMLGGDAETIPPDDVRWLANKAVAQQVDQLLVAVNKVGDSEKPVLLSGSGEFLAREALSGWLGPIRSVFHDESCRVAAPAYAVAVLASERPL